MNPSEALFHRAQKSIPGGVNSPVRAFKGVGGHPIFFQRAQGSYLYDVAGNSYVDYVASWGPMILGHGDADVVAAVQQQAANALGFGAPTEIEIDLAELICRLVPSIEQVRLVNSGTEATMSALRLARGVTGRNKIIKFEGCYHGHGDSLLVKAGSGALTLGVPGSAGVPTSLAELTLTLPFNDLSACDDLFKNIGSEIAAVIVEPVAGNMNCIPPVPGFLPGLRELCNQYGTVLIFDEVMTGFRVALGGAQSLYGVTPDLTTLGKVIGGGLPVGAFGGRRELMDHLAPNGDVYQAGTLSGNPLSVTAGLTTLKKLTQDGFYEALTAATSTLLRGLESAAEKSNIPFSTQQVGGMFGIFFHTDKAIRSFAQVNQSNIQQFQQFFHGMLEAGVYFAPSAFEAGFVSCCHHQEQIEFTVAAAEKVFAQISK